MLLSGTILSIYANGWGPDNVLFWTSLYNCRVIYALSTFYFLLFSVPIMGASFTGSAKPTAYDEDGRLVPTMSGSGARPAFAR